MHHTALLPILRHRPVVTTMACLAASFVAACAGTTPSRKITEAQAADKAIVIVAASLEPTIHRGLWASYYLDYPGSGGVILNSPGNTFPLPVSSDIRHERAHVYVLEIEPGHHVLKTWQLLGGFSKTFPLRPRPLEFDIAKGEVLYLGDLHMQGVPVQGESGGPIRPVVVDGSSTQVPYAVAKFPALAGKVRMALLPQGPWPSAGTQEKAASAGDDPQAPPPAP